MQEDCLRFQTRCEKEVKDLSNASFYSSEISLYSAFFYSVADLSIQIIEMISEVEMQRNVVARPVSSDGKLLACPRYLITQALEHLLAEKANQEHGYFLAVSSLKSIDKGQVLDESGYTSFTLTFKCRTFKPVVGDFLQGVVHYISREGVFLQTGPVRYAFLPVFKMPGYSYVPEENPFFLHGETHSKIRIGVVVYFVVLGVSWIEKTGSVEKEFALVASIQGEILGPVSLPGTYDLEQ